MLHGLGAHTGGRLMPQTTPQLPPAPAFTVGLDVGDRHTQLCVLDGAGVTCEVARIATTPAALAYRFQAHPRLRIVLETGTHSPWIDRQLRAWGHETIVANARRLRLISENAVKSDHVDAETLARLGRLDPQLLAPIQHRQATTQCHLAQLRARDALVRTRTLLINHVRGAVKSFGARLPRSSAESFPQRAAPALPEDLAPILTPLLEQIRALTAHIRGAETALARLAAQYPATQQLRQVSGVGPVTALAYVLVLETPTRFATGRHVGAYLGLTPGRAQSGRADPQRRITKQGDALLRRLLVGSAQYILGPFGPDCALRRWGHGLAARGGQNGKKRAVVAVARKLAALLHHLWLTGAPYAPLHA
jgi:transposase